MFIQLKRYQWAFLFACASMFVLGLADNIRGPLFPELLNYFQLTNSQGSLTYAASSTAALTGNMLSAYLLKKMNIGQALLWSMVIMCMGLLGMGLAPTYISYILCAVMFGLGLGFLGVMQNLIVAENVSKEMQSKTFSGLHGVYGLSSLLAPLIASRAPVIFGPWRSAFFITSAIGAFIYLSSFVFKSETKFEVHHESSEANGSVSKWALITFGGIFAFYVMTEVLVSTRLALYMRTFFNMDLEASSNYVTYFFIFLLIGRLIFTFKVFSHNLKKQLNISLVLSIMSLALGLWFHPFFLALVGLMMAPFYPLSVAYISEETGVHKRKFITFAVSFQSFCIIAMHLGVGYLTDHFGLLYAFTVGFIALGFSLLCVNFHPKVFKAS